MRNTSQNSKGDLVESQLADRRAIIRIVTGEMPVLSYNGFRISVAQIKVALIMSVLFRDMAPTLQVLAECCGSSKGQMFRVMKALELIGAIKKQKFGGKIRPIAYRLDMDWFAKVIEPKATRRTA